MKYKITYINKDKAVKTKTVIQENVGTAIDDLIASGCIIEECYPS